MRTTHVDVENAFRDWLRLTGVASGNAVGKFRLGSDGYGRWRIEQIINEAGAIHVMSPGMESRAFIDSVYFLQNSLATIDNPYSNIFEPDFKPALTKHPRSRRKSTTRRSNTTSLRGMR